MGETRNDPSSVHRSTSIGYLLRHFGQYFCIHHAHLQHFSRVTQAGAVGKEFVGLARMAFAESLEADREAPPRARYLGCSKLLTGTFLFTGTPGELMKRTRASLTWRPFCVSGWRLETGGWREP